MSQKGSILILLTAVIFLVILGIGGYLLTKKPQDSTISQISDDDFTFETRNIYLHGLKIDVPTDWTLNEANLKQDCADYLVRSNDDNALLYLKPTCKTSDNKIPDPPKNTIVLKDYGSLTLGIEAKLFYGGPDGDKNKYLKTSDRIISSIKKL